MIYLIKVLLSSVIIVLVSEVSKRSSSAAAVLGSLPLGSLLAFLFLYSDTKDAQMVAKLSMGIFFMVIPSLIFFLALTYFIRRGWNFPVSLGSAIAMTVICDFSFFRLLRGIGVEL